MVCGLRLRKRPPRRRAPVGAIAVGAALIMSGCALSYVDDDGSRHIIGFASVVIPPPDRNEPTAGNVIDLTTIGLSFNDMPEGQSLTLGYSRAVTATLKDNSLVLGNPLAIREQTHGPTERFNAAVPVDDGDCIVCIVPGGVAGLR